VTNDQVDWRNSIIWGLTASGSHVSPLRAVTGLTAAQADLEPSGGLHSAHRLLHHVVYWQDLMVASAAGEQVVWLNGPEDWGAPMPPWNELVARLAAGLARAQQVAATTDLSGRIPAWGPDKTRGHALTVLITHNSYHLGQLVDARRATGHWPPPTA